MTAWCERPPPKDILHRGKEYSPFHRFRSPGYAVDSTDRIDVHYGRYIPIRDGASVDIDEIRKRIDLLDDVLLRILNERARLALEIGHVKKELGLPVFDPAREKRIFARMKGDNPGPLDDGAVVRLFERVVDESRRLERTRSQGEGREGC